MSDAPLRIAMWSGPRNISTAMMRSWGNRADTFVCDEPLYPHYLSVTHRAHPGAAEVLAKGPTDVQSAIDFVTGPVPGGKPIFYQKHMTHHLLPHIDRGWLRKLSNCFLIREPREVITSFIKQMPDANLADLGFAQQTEIFDLVCKWTNKIPPVIDARDVQDNPKKILAALCDALNVQFSEQMLSWPPGPRQTDGIWAKYWYKDVEQSTGFKPYRAKNEPVPEHLEELVATCENHYHRMHQHRIK